MEGTLVAARSEGESAGCVAVAVEARGESVERGEALFGAQMAVEVQREPGAVEVALVVEDMGFDGCRGAGSADSGACAYVEHHAVMFAADTCGGEIDAVGGDEFGGMRHSDVGGREPDAASQLLPFDDSAGQSVGMSEQPRGAGHIPLGKGVADLRRAD